MANGELLKTAKNEVRRIGSINKVAKATGVNPGVIWRVLHGGNSPTLRRIWKIPKNDPRPRLTIDCPRDAIVRFDALRGDMSRGEFIETLMDYWCGVGKVV